MNGAKKFHKPTGPAFHERQLWVAYQIRTAEDKLKAYEEA